jgi:hypothetical protein
MEVTAGDWLDLDPWWASAVDPNQRVIFGEDSMVVDPGFLHHQWPVLDRWWNSTVHSEKSLLIDRAPTIGRDWSKERWFELAPWWDTYLDARNEDVTELLTELEAADNAWDTNPGRFDADPLSADWQTSRGSTGPIRISREEDWSYGFAHLLRSGSGKLVEELFGAWPTERASSVRTEAHLPGGDETTRYEDILLTGPEGGVSIEVKIGDTNLRKTLDTAALVELLHTGDWKHFLLLPEYQLPDLRETFGDDLSEPESGPPVITAERTPDVKILYWRDVSAALRTLLQRDNELPPHWEASAYVFCTVIEQRILGLVPRPSIERMSKAAGVIHDSGSLSVGIGDIQSEIEYLKETVESEGAE